MPWNWVVGQDRVVDVLRRAVAADRVSQAYLFHGPDGTGKRVAALALAQALECERRQPGEGDACGTCGPCRKVARMVHPDVHVYLAQPKSADEHDVGARLQLLAEDPYTEISYRRLPDIADPQKAGNLKPFYAVDRVRSINRDLRFTPAEGLFKVAILTEVDTMRKEAANAFLKSLEEPTPRTTLVLTAGRPDALLPTIVSRCQRVRFEAISPGDIEAALLERGATEPVHAALLARMADGSLTQALALAQSTELASRRDLVVQFFRLSYAADVAALEGVIQELARLGREPLKDVFLLMMAWVRDLVLARSLGGDAPLVNVDQRDAIIRFVGNLPNARLDDMASLVQHAMDLIQANVNTTLTLITLSDSLRDAMRGRARRQLFDALTS